MKIDINATSQEVIDALLNDIPETQDAISDWGIQTQTQEKADLWTLACLSTVAWLLDRIASVLNEAHNPAFDQSLNSKDRVVPVTQQERNQLSNDIDAVYTRVADLLSKRKVEVQDVMPLAAIRASLGLANRRAGQYVDSMSAHPSIGELLRQILGEDYSEATAMEPARLEDAEDQENYGDQPAF